MKMGMKPIVASLLMLCGFSWAAPLNISQIPLFLTESAPPLTMLVIGRDHKLYFEAYNDATDVNGNGSIDLGFNPTIDYYGYFDSYKCYSYNHSEHYFYPVSLSPFKTCQGQWSGNFLNYLTTARLDAIRKVLYGGYRETDGNSLTLLERTYIPQDGHSWGKEYTNPVSNGYSISLYAPLSTPAASYGTTRRHLFANTTLRNGSNIPLLRVSTNQPYRIWEWVSIERPVAGSRVIHGSNGPFLNTIEDYRVRVKVCDPQVGLEENCQAYPRGNFKPIGLLQEFGANNSMYFGLITGSYRNNLAGGVLRKNISSFSDEINENNGKFSAVNGIVSTLNKLTVTGFRSDYTYQCGWITRRNIQNGECEMWGTPLAEMMYEALRYFAGKGAPTSAFDYSSGTDVNLGLPKPAWQNPYAQFPYCSKPNMLIINDLYPSYDGELVPGSVFGGFSGDISGLNVSSQGQTIFSGEGFSLLKAFIGQSGAITDGAPSPKTVTSFGNIRGLSPQESNSEGSFYSASIAYYAWQNDINPVKGTQNIKTFVVGLSSSLPEFKFKVGGNLITLVPYAKSVGPNAGSLAIDSAQKAYQPNNNIVDYYIDEISPTRAVFRINFEDVQQGADFDMDAIVRYEVTVVGSTLQVNLSSEYAAGSIIQHMGYVISGTTQDGVYLEVRDADTSVNQDINYFLDTPPGQLPGGNWNTGKALPLHAARIFFPSNQATAITFQSPLWYAAKWGGFKDENGNNIPDLISEWDSNNDGDPDNFFLVNNARTLREQLKKAFDLILDRTGSFSSAALSSGFLSADTFLYQAIFRTSTWSGQLLAFKIDPNSGEILLNGTGPGGSQWDASAILNTKNYNNGRKIITYKPSQSKGIPFRWPIFTPGNNDLDNHQIAALNNSPVSGVSDNLGTLRLNYLRGDRSLEQRNGGAFRNRLSVLGDIIHSNPVVIAAPNANYPLNWGENAAENNASYNAFRQSKAGRTPTIYIGANDGMLHAFDANTGEELLAYVPAASFSHLNRLTDPSYAHHYYVDGSPTVVDAFVQNNWHSILVGNLNAGGQGIYALDVTDPAQFNESAANTIVRWEFTDAQDADMGFSFSNASIVRLNNGKWAAVFGNGYNNTVTDGNSSTTGNAVLFIVDLEDGSLIKKFDTKQGMNEDPLGQGRPNGMSTPTVVDLSGNYSADYVYAGDLFGNVWKIDLTSEQANQWDFVFKQGNHPTPLFIAEDASGNRQPITTAPTLSRLDYSASGLQVYFGTGKYIESSDKTDKSIQSVYAIRDENTSPISGRTELRQQTILAETVNSRVVSSNQLANNDRGWYMDLLFSGFTAGERVVSPLLFLGDKIIFTTTIPSPDPCDYGGDSWLMELNALNGARLNYSVFDLNHDGQFNSGDYVNIGSGGTTTLVPTSGIKSEVGLVSTPSVLNAGNKEYKYMPGTSGGIQTINENPGKQTSGRQSWRQLQ